MKKTPRLEKSPLTLVRDAMGPPAGWPGKGRRLVELLRVYGQGEVVRTRLDTLQRLGVIEQVPTTVQLVVGSIDMLRFWISPAAADYYKQQGLHYGFHQLLRFLDEPASLGDPIGVLSTQDAIIGHLMQVVHANPLYDVQLLQMYDGGVEELVRQLESMLRGDHPRARSIGAIVEEADYHEKLLGFLRDYLRDPMTPPILRKNIGDSTFAPLEKIFGSMTGAMRYFTRLPKTPSAALRHLVTVREFPWALV